MRLPDDLIRNVVFYGVLRPDGSTAWGGTAFFLSVRLENHPEYAATYLVTARHNVDDAAADRRKYGGEPCLRVNRRGKGAEIVRLRGAKWLRPRDRGSDVAVVRWSPPNILDWATVERTTLVTPEVVDREHIGIGDDLFMVGLFTRRAGTSRNEPIVRTGIIAAAPSEPILNGRTGKPMKGCYLAELRSIGGLSGSPVYVYLASDRVDWATKKHRKASSFFLFGVVHGHWPLDKSKFIATNYGDGDEPLNTGIAVISPITAALKLIYAPSEIAWRAERAAIHRASEAPVADIEATTQ